MITRFYASRSKPQGAEGRTPSRIEASDVEASIYLYDEIGFFGVSASDFANQLRALKAPTIHLRLNSPGGDVFDARAIVTAIREHPSQVIAHVDGLAASAASYIMTACDEVEISDGAMVMIHQPFGTMTGTASDMRATADLLDQIEESMISDYEKKSGKSRDNIKAWMEAETWFTSADALANGLVDRIAGKEAPSALDHSQISNRIQAHKALLAARLRLAEVSK